MVARFPSRCGDQGVERGADLLLDPVGCCGWGSGNAKQHHSVQLIGFQCVRTQASVLVVEVCACGFSFVNSLLQIVGVVEEVCELGVEWLEGFGGGRALRLSLIHI